VACIFRSDAPRDAATIDDMRLSNTSPRLVQWKAMAWAEVESHELLKRFFTEWKDVEVET
jgi:hypothetical protein